MSSPKTKAILRQIRPRLAKVYGERLRGVVLFGSEARGEAEPDSDIDLLVLLEGPVDVGQEITTIVHQGTGVRSSFRWEATNVVREQARPRR